MENTSSWDNVWEKIFKESDWGKYPAEGLIQFIARNFYKADRPNVKILELGCGTGANIWYISREGFSAYGIDGSKTAIDKAQARLLSENLNAKLTVGDILKLPYDDDFFDAIIDVECLCCNNYENTRTILKETNRVLKLGGKFYSRTFSDKMFIGNEYEKIADNEYTSIKEGPFADKGFVRLTSNENAKNLYGEIFNIKSIDTIEYSQFNGAQIISEHIIICEK